MRIDTLPRLVPLQPSGAVLGQWIQQLRSMYAKEIRLALELDGLFHLTNWLPLRLMLSDQRKETRRHVARLSCLVASVNGYRPTPVQLLPDRKVPPGHAWQLPAAAVIAGPLRASHVAVTAYQAALAAATERGLGYAVSLLTTSLAEETTTSRRLALLAAEINNQ